MYELMTRYSSVEKSITCHTIEGWINNSLLVVVVLQILRGIIAEESFDRAECSANPLFELEAGITPLFSQPKWYEPTFVPSARKVGDTPRHCSGVSQLRCVIKYERSRNA